jgi:hypothetical protein
MVDLKPQDKVAAAVVIPPEEAKVQPEEGTLLRRHSSIHMQKPSICWAFCAQIEVTTSSNDP